MEVDNQPKIGTMDATVELSESDTMSVPAGDHATRGQVDLQSVAQHADISDSRNHQAMRRDGSSLTCV